MPSSNGHGIGNINGGSSHANGNGSSHVNGNGPQWCDPLVVQSHWWWFV
jgi:hypothetical protein